MTRSKSSKSFVKSARILVVEDDDSTYELVKKRLEAEGFQLSRAHTGFKAMELSSESPSDLILLDYQLPDMTARQIIEFLNCSGLNIPFVIMTAHGDEELAVEMMNLGARDYVVKDERFWEALPAKITQVLNRLQSEMKLAEAEEDTRRFNAPLLFLKILGIAFAAKVLAMLFLRLLPGLEAGLFEAVLDASMMTIISAPFLWWFIIRPLRSVAIIENVRAKNIIANAADAIVTFDERGVVESLNPTAERIFGYAAHEIVGRDIKVIMPESQCNTGEEQSASPHRELLGRRKDGGDFLMDVTLSEILLGKCRISTAIIRDITERKQAAEALIAAKARLQYLLTSSPAVIYSAKPTGGFGTTFISANIKELMGYEPQDFLDDSKFWRDHIHPEDAPHIFAELSLLFEKKQHTYEYRFQHKDGTYRWMRDELTVVRDVKDNPVEIVGYWIDITERKLAEEEFRQLHAENEQLLSAIPSILIGTDTAMCIRRWNSAAEKTFGIKAITAEGRLLSEVDIQWDWDGINTMMAKCKKRNEPAPSRTVRYTRVDGRDGFLSVSASPVKRNNQETDGYLLLGTEITERKVLENQLVQAQKLESIGQLAAGIAHEINTPIQYVGDNTRFLQEAYNDLNILLDRYGKLYEAAKSQEGVLGKEVLDEIATCLEDIDLEYLIDEIPIAVEQSLGGVERVAKIVRSMKEFSHPGTAEKTTADLNKAIESTITVSRNEWKYTAEVITDFDPSLPLVPCFPGELNQVILNMIINASHAIADVTKDVKGKITISTRHDGDWAEIRVGDTGSGIPEEIKSKIFDPFFTTKEIGKGTGQGLAISHNVVVEKHGGTLTCESEVGQGTTLVIRLPLNGSESAA